MKVKVADLIGNPLRWAVAMAEDMSFYPRELFQWDDDQEWLLFSDGSIRHAIEDQNNSSMNRRYIYTYWKPDEDWDQGGPILQRLIEEEFILQKANCNLGFKVWRVQNDTLLATYGSNPLIAAMRCSVLFNFGEEIDVPDKIAS